MMRLEITYGAELLGKLAIQHLLTCDFFDTLYDYINFFNTAYMSFFG